LGETPWESRATAFEPDAIDLLQNAAKVNAPACIEAQPSSAQKVSHRSGPAEISLAGS